MKNAISRRNGDEILPEFRERVQKCLNSLRIAENLQNFDKIGGIFAIGDKIQSKNSIFHSCP